MSDRDSLTYRQIYESHHQVKLSADLEIHHKDGDYTNNQIDNLQAVTVFEHLEIHKRQGDWGAVQAILMRIENGDISKYARLHALKRLEEGTHNFQTMDPKRRSEISRATGYKTKELGIGIHKLNSDKELHRKYSSEAGKRAVALKAGIHSPHHNRSDVTRNTCWWTNTETGQMKRSKSPPDGPWKRGMKRASTS